MTVVVDLDALQAAAGIRVTLAENVRVRDRTLTSEATQGFGDLRSVELVASVPLIRGQSSPGVTVTVQGSANGSDWTTAHAFTFTASGEQSFTLDDPPDYLRVVCAPVGGLRDAVVASVVAVPAFVDPAASPGSGTVSEITSEDESVTITNRTGPTVDLAVASPGGSQPGAFTSSEFVATEEAANGPTYAIVDADSGGGFFKIAGDHTDRFPADPLNNYAGVPFIVTGSTGNDGTYTVQSVSLDSGNTLIFPNEGIADDTNDGSIISPRLYSATFDISEGSVITDMCLYNGSDGGAWAADTAALLTVQDSTGDYFRNVGLDANTGQLTNHYPTSPNDGLDASRQIDLAVRPHKAASDFTKPWEGSWALNDNFSNIDVANTTPKAAAWIKGAGGGRRFASDDTIYMLVAAVSATPPGTATGLLIVKVSYFTPATAIPATGS